MLTSRLLAALLPLAVVVPAFASAPVDPVGPERAIQMAQEHPQAGAEGRFRMRVAATGSVRHEHYLNSHPDYRDPSCLTVVIKRGALRSIRKHFGAEPAEAFMGKEIIVSGTVHRSKIRLRGDDETYPYYFQTHVDVTSADQIQVVE